MGNKTKIQQVNFIDFQFQQYIENDNNIIPSFYIDTIFDKASDYITLNIYDENKIKISNYIEYDPNHYSIINGNIILTPEEDLTQLDLVNGSFYIEYNFLRKRLSSDYNNLYYISEISSDRTEIRLSSNQISSSYIINSVSEFINVRNNSQYFIDFYLNFGDNNLLIANNIKIDELSSTPSVIIKLYEPLPLNYNLKDTLWVVEPISDPQTYLVSFPDDIKETIDYEYIKGPNFYININSQIGSSDNSFSFNDLINSNVSTSQQQINNILNKKGIDININYENFSNFTHFSSVKSRLENFYYKASLIENYQGEIDNFLGNITGSTISSFSYNTSYNILTSSINSIINNFDGYEYFLYFNSGSSYSWPKKNSQPPYQLYETGSYQVINWIENLYNLTSEYDENNQDWLFWTIPEYLRNDSENDNYIIFLNMIGQYFDNIWIYINNITNKFNADNRLQYGISKNLVADTLKDFGIKLYSNNFNINDLYTSFLGITPSGSIFLFPNISEVLPAPSGYEYIDAKISSSNENIIPLNDLNKSIYKRIYHNLPYLFKTKGTTNGLKALINIYGIPDTILNITEFGGKDKNNSNDWDYSQDVFNYAFDTQNGTQYLNTKFISNENFGWSPANTIQFRFKSNRIPVQNFSQSLFTLTSGSSVISSIVLEYNNLNSISGSYSGSISDIYNQWGLIKYIPDSSIPNISASVYLPIFNEDWWNIQATFNSSLTASISVANKIDGKLGFNEYNSISGSFSNYFSSSIDFSYLSFSSSYSIGGKVYTPFEGQFQELRYYNTIINTSSFYDFVLNPYSVKGNSDNSTPEELYFRAPLGSTLCINSRTSIHPKISGSWNLTSSFESGSSNFTLSSGSFVENRETIYFDQPIAGIKNAINDKINIEDMVIPEGNTLSPFLSIQQQSFASSSYTPDINYVEVAFSPQNQINNDIMSQLGYINLGDYIGDPRDINNGEYTYSGLDKLRNEYFEKYIHNYNLNDFIRLIKYFDNSLFKMLKDFIPAKSDLATGIVLKQHLLERNKQKPVQVSYDDELYTSSIKNLPNNYEEESLIYSIEGGSGGSFTNINVNYQQWSQSLHFPYNPTSSVNNAIRIADNREFYNGELPGSSTYTQLKEHCQQYKTSSIGFEHDFDCQPNLNNIETLRPNSFTQEADYSVGTNIPVNFDQIITDTATRGTVPESNYTLKRHKNPRYDGSKVSSDGVNLSTGLTGSYDNYPPVESKKVYFAYINNIVDPYPLINNKTYFKVKYLIDDQTNINSPLLDKSTYFNLIDTFNNIEEIKSSLNIPKQESQFIILNNYQSIYKTAQIAVPILYSQTSSNGYANEITLFKSNQGIISSQNNNEIIYEPINNIILPNTQSFNISPVPITSSIYMESSKGTGSVIIGGQFSGMVSASNLSSDYNISWDIIIPINLYSPSSSLTNNLITFNGLNTKLIDLKSTYVVSSSLSISYTANDSLNGYTGGIAHIYAGYSSTTVGFGGNVSFFSISNISPSSDSTFIYSTPTPV